MGAPARTAPFTQAVINSMRRLYPEALADKSFDNTGLLLEAPFHHERRMKNSVLLTIDLTKAVADEAIQKRVSTIVTYHPIIFRGLKSLTFADKQQQSLLRLAAEGISVYCPHTAVDAAPGGNGDWLASVVEGTIGHELEQLNKRRQPIKKVNVSGVEGAGMGRVVQLEQPTELSILCQRIKDRLDLPGLCVAVPQGKRLEDMTIKSFAVCAGSGGSVFSHLDDAVDLLVTGELSHHEALAAIEKGQCLIMTFHSNSERGFLMDILRNQLSSEMETELKALYAELQGDPDQKQSYGEALDDVSCEVVVSQADRDPFIITTN